MTEKVPGQDDTPEGTTTNGGSAPAATEDEGTAAKDPDATDADAPEEEKPEATDASGDAANTAADEQTAEVTEGAEESGGTGEEKDQENADDQSSAE